MHRFLALLASAMFLASFAGAQQKHSSHTAAPGSHAATQSSRSAEETKLPSEETVNAFMHEMFGYDSTLTWRVVDIRPSEAAGLAEVTVAASSPKGQDTTVFYVTADGKHAVVGQIIPFGAHPFAADLQKLKEGVNGPSRGPADAPVTLVEFSDLQCPHCKAEEPTVDKLLEDDKNVRLVFQNFPLPMHDWAMKAAEYADCVGRSSTDAFWKFVESVYNAQSDITSANADEKLTALADQSGVKGSEIAECAAKPETTTRVQHSIDLGKALNVTGTPTAFINGRQMNIGGMPEQVLKQFVDFYASQAGQK